MLEREGLFEANFEVCGGFSLCTVELGNEGKILIEGINERVNAEGK